MAVLEVLVKHAHVSGSTWFRRSWYHLDLHPVDGAFTARFLVLCRRSNVLRSGLILALQSSKAVHLGVGNLNVVRHVGRIMAGKDPEKPCELFG